MKWEIVLQECECSVIRWCLCLNIWWVLCSVNAFTVSFDLYFDECKTIWQFTLSNACISEPPEKLIKSLRKSFVWKCWNFFQRKSLSLPHFYSLLVVAAEIISFFMIVSNPLLAIVLAFNSVDIECDFVRFFRIQFSMLEKPHFKFRTSLPTCVFFTLCPQILIAKICCPHAFYPRSTTLSHLTKKEEIPFKSVEVHTLPIKWIDSTINSNFIFFLSLLSLCLKSLKKWNRLWVHEFIIKSRMDRRHSHQLFKLVKHCCWLLYRIPNVL